MMPIQQGEQRRHEWLGMGVLGIVTGVIAFGGLNTFAATRTTVEERLAARQHQLEERRSSSTQNQDQSPTNEGTCDCSAKFSYARPDLLWSGNQLYFIPRIDISIRTEGTGQGPSWNATLSYDGIAHATPYSGNASWGGQCFDNRLNYKGYELPPVSLSGITRNIFTSDNALEGSVRMHAALSGCGDVQEDHRQFGFEIEQFGNLDTSSWRRVR